MFCDHYLLVSPSLNSFQLNTCTSYYQNALRQPWYTALVTQIPILIGAIIMFKNMRRSIYDMLSVPIFMGVVAIFLIKIKHYIELLAAENETNQSGKESHLRQIAYNHVIIGVLLVILLVLQVLAERTPNKVTKKNQ